jgi:hypothetical protein
MDGPIRLHEEKKDLEEWTLEKLKANKQSQKKTLCPIFRYLYLRYTKKTKANAATYELCMMFGTQ